MNVYLLRAPLSLLKSVDGAAKCTEPTIETQPGRERVRSPNGFGQMRVVMEGDPPADTAVSTWRLIGHTSMPGFTRYTPLERCKRNHPPLRYLSNGGCVYCMREGRAEALVRLRLQIPLELLGTFDDTVKMFSWSIAPGKGRISQGRKLIAVEAKGRREECVAAARAMGWEVSLW